MRSSPTDDTSAWLRPAVSSELLNLMDIALDRSDERAFISALRIIVKAQLGFGEVAQQTGLNRTALYNVLSGEHDPRLSTIMRLLPALGLRFSLQRSDKRRMRRTKIQSK